MSVGEKQEKFAVMWAHLILFCSSQGYKVRQKHILRCENCLTGHPTSLHKLGLAGDLVLMLDGEVITDTLSYTFAGEYWESMGGSWGGSFNDGGHFSIAHNGMR